MGGLAYSKEQDSFLIGILSSQCKNNQGLLPMNYRINHTGIAMRNISHVVYYIKDHTARWYKVNWIIVSTSMPFTKHGGHVDIRVDRKFATTYGTSHNVGTQSSKDILYPMKSRGIAKQRSCRENHIADRAGVTHIRKPCKNTIFFRRQCDGHLCHHRIRTCLNSRSWYNGCFV